MAAIEGSNMDLVKGPRSCAEMRAIDTQSLPHSESRWPRGWRPYAALLAGFCGMANCW